MSVQVKLTAVKNISNASTTSVVELTNFNFATLTSAIKEFLLSINYEQGQGEVSVDINSVTADLMAVRQGLSVYGAQLQNGNFPTVIKLDPSGTVLSNNFIAEDVTDTLRLRLRVYGALPVTGIPGEIVYIEPQGNRVEGVYVWLNSTGWTLLSGGGGGGNAPCMQEVIMTSFADSVPGDNTLASSSLFTVPAPLAMSAFTLFVNGQQVLVGDADLTAPAYLSKDGGVTASAYNQVDSTDLLYWNSSVSGYPLATDDRLALRYFTLDPYCSQSGYSCSTQAASGATTPFNQFGVTIIGSPSQAGPLTICKTPNPNTNSGGSSLPSTFQLQNSVLSYVISDPNGIFSGGAIVRFTLPQSISLADFNAVRVFHEVGGSLVDETILVGLYAPDYANRWIYAQVNSFSPFYLIKEVLATTTSTTSTTTVAPGSTTTTTSSTTTTTTCAPNQILYAVPATTTPTHITFYGSPIGPFDVTFVDQYGSSHNLTGLAGSLVSFGWTFDLNQTYYAGIPTVVGTYTFTNGSGCSYTVTVPIPSTTTTTTAAPTTTTTTIPGQTTTTTSTSTTTTTTAAPCPNTVTYYTGPGSTPSLVTFVGSPIGPYTIQFTEATSGIQYYLGSAIQLPWIFDKPSYYAGSIPSIYGNYKFIAPGCTFTKLISQPATTTTTTAASTTTTTHAPLTTTTTSSTTTTTTAAPSTTTTTTAAPTTTTTTTTAFPCPGGSPVTYSYSLDQSNLIFNLDLGLGFSGYIELWKPSSNTSNPSDYSGQVDTSYGSPTYGNFQEIPLETGTWTVKTLENCVYTVSVAAPSSTTTTTAASTTTTTTASGVSTTTTTTASPCAATVTYPPTSSPTEQWLYCDKMVNSVTSTYSNILGNSTNEDALIAYAVSKGYTGLALYDMHKSPVSTGSAAVTFTTTGKNLIKAFAAKCYAAGLKVAIVRSGSQAQSSCLIDYNAGATTSQKISAMFIENAWWNSGSFTNFTALKSNLSAKRTALHSAGIDIYCYVAWSKTNGSTYADGSVVTGGDELAQLQCIVDVFCLHDYQLNGIPNYSYIKTRIRQFTTPVNVMAILSAESTDLNASGVVASQYNFQGNWLEGKDSATGGSVIYTPKTIQDAYDLIFQSGTVQVPAQTGSPKSFVDDTYTNLHTNVNVLGMTVFTQSVIRQLTTG